MSKSLFKMAQPLSHREALNSTNLPAKYSIIINVIKFNVVIKQILSLLMINTCTDIQYTQVLHLQQINNLLQKKNIYLLS